MGIITTWNKNPHPNAVLSCKICNGETNIITGCMDGITRLFNIQQGELLMEFVDDEIVAAPASVTGIALMRKEPAIRSFVTSYSEGFMKYWNAANGTCLRTVKEDRQILGLHQNPHDAKFLTLGSDGIIYYYDIETGQKIRSFMNSSGLKPEGHSSRVFAAAFHPKQMNEFISGGWDNTILYWDMRKPTAYRSILGPHICGEGLDINPTGHLILSCSYSNYNPFQMFEYATGKNYISMEYKKNKLYCGKWLAPMFVATGSSEPAILNIVDMYSINVIAYYKSIDNGIYSMDYIDLNRMKKSKKDEDLNAVILFTSGNNLISVKLEFTHKSSLQK